MKLKTTAEHLVSLLGAHGMEYLFLNPGTDTAPVQEAVYSLGEAGLPAPTVLLSTFESVSLAAAHAYWNMTGRPQAVFVHVDAGTQNLGARCTTCCAAGPGWSSSPGRPPTGGGGASGGRTPHPVASGRPRPAGHRPRLRQVDPGDHPAGDARPGDRPGPAGRRQFPGGHGLPDGVARRADGPAARRPLAGHRVPCAASARGRPGRGAPIAAALAAAESPVLVTSRVGRTDAGFTAVTHSPTSPGCP